MPAWQQLKTEASAALREWKKANPDKALDDKPFWMTGEAWGHGVMQSDYYRHGFNAMINFDYQEQAARESSRLSGADGYDLAANGGEIAGFQRVELPLVA